MLDLRYICNKKCPECNNNIFHYENNYTICFNCGLIIESKNIVNNFKPSGFKIEEGKKENENI